MKLMHYVIVVLISMLSGASTAFLVSHGGGGAHGGGGGGHATGHEQLGHTSTHDDYTQRSSQTMSGRTQWGNWEDRGAWIGNRWEWNAGDPCFDNSDDFGCAGPIYPY
jgi:hypothetical protein